jgi:hypothetical protein
LGEWIAFGGTDGQLTLISPDGQSRRISRLLPPSIPSLIRRAELGQRLGIPDPGLK